MAFLNIHSLYIFFFSTWGVIFFFWKNFYAAAQFTFNSVTVSAESVDGPTPAARVTWSTTAPPECVTSVRVEFRTRSRGPVVTNYTTNDTSGTAVIQTRLRCTTYYYITVEVTGETSDGQRPTRSSRPVKVFVNGGKV